MNDQSNPVTQVLKAYRNAVTARDVEAFVALYDEDIHLFDAWDTWEYSGAAAWQEVVAGWFSTHPEGQLDVQFDNVEVVIKEEAAFVHARYSFAVITADERGHEQVLRYTAGLEKQGETWKIVHEHTSIPVSDETGMGIRSR